MKTNSVTKFIYFASFISGLFSLITIQSFAQKKVPLLEHTLTISFHNEKLDVVLSKIAEEGKFSFSYNPAIIDVNITIKLEAKRKTVREILNIIFKGKIEYKQRSHFIILQKAKIEQEPVSPRNESIIISGYIVSPEGEKLPLASIYDKQSMASCVSDNFGFYFIELQKSTLPAILKISKKEYKDTLLTIASSTNEFIYITLTKEPDTMALEKLFASAEENIRSFFMTSTDFANTNNIKDSLNAPWQVSFIPFVGTNGKLSGNIVNNYSFNVVGGFSRGTEKLEVGGVFNINRQDAKYVQFAGFSNSVGGNFKGVQIAGFANTVRKDVNGVQLSGFLNLTWKNIDGIALAGYLNVIRGKSSGVLLSGYLNLTVDTSTGAQFAGFSNIALRKMEGIQVAGFANVAYKEIEGVQVAPFNYAKKLNGVQIGVFNYSNTCSGIPIGILSYVNNGYHKLEVSADEIFYTNLSFRTGVKAFHNIISTGVRPSSDRDQLWTFGYGLGTTLPLGKKLAVDLDITSNQVIKGDSLNKLNLINKAYLGFDIKLAKKLSLSIGGTVNGQLTKTNYHHYPEIFSDYEPHVFYYTNYSSSNLSLRMWLGGKIALRFF